MTTDEIIKVLRHCAKTYSVTGCFECMMYGTSDGAPDCIIRLLILAADELARLNAATAMVNAGGGVQFGRVNGELTINRNRAYADPGKKDKRCAHNDCPNYEPEETEGEDDV